MDEEVVVHINNGILLSHRKNEIMPFAATWMEEPGGLPSMGLHRVGHD